MSLLNFLCIVRVNKLPYSIVEYEKTACRFSLLDYSEDDIVLCYRHVKQIWYLLHILLIRIHYNCEAIHMFMKSTVVSVNVWWALPYF